MANQIYSRERRSVVANLKFKKAVTLTSATATLKDEADGIVGGIDNLTAQFLNSTETLTADTDWTVWYVLAPNAPNTPPALIPGEYSMYYLVTDADGLIYEPVVAFNVDSEGAGTSPPDIPTKTYDTVKILLQIGDADLPREEVSLWYDFIYTQLSSTYSCIADYSSLNASDKKFISLGMAYLTAAQIYSYKPKTVPRTAIVRMQQQSSNFEFAQPAKSLLPQGADNWGTDAYTALSRVSCIRTALDVLRTGAGAFHVFSVDGPSRTSLDRGNRPTLYSTIANILSTSYDFGGPLGVDTIWF